MKEEEINFKIIENKLDSDEQIEKIVKVVDITSIDFVTDSSMIRGNLSNTMEYGIFKNLYFTNKRIFLVDINLENQYILDTDYKLEDILDIRFTSNYFKVKQNEDGEFYIKERMPKGKIISITLVSIFLAFFLLLYFHNAKSTAIIFMVGILCCLAVFIITTVREDTIDELQVLTKDGDVYKMYIAGVDYEETKEYMQNRLEN